MITLDESQANRMNKPLRTRKVYYRYYDRDTRDLHPMIRLEGFYLADKGFKIGDRIAVDIEFGRITITKINPERESIRSNKQKRLSQK